LTCSVVHAHPPVPTAAKLVDFYSPQRQDRLLGDRLPLLANYRVDDHELIFAAVVHSSDRQSPTFRMIAQAFRTGPPGAVILEGFPTNWGPNPPHVMKKIAAADSGDSYAMGEDMYAARLAQDSGATVWGAEPDDAALAAQLRKLGFSSRDLFFASMFGPLAQDHEAKLFTKADGPAFEKSYRGWAAENAKAYDPAAPLDSAAFKAWFRKHYGRSLDRDTEWFTRGGPGQAGIAGAIGRASNRIRDQHMFTLAANLLQTNEHVLVVAGGSHLSNQWRALEAAFGRAAIRSYR
jgi:hypothetical protein